MQQVKQVYQHRNIEIIIKRIKTIRNSKSTFKSLRNKTKKQNKAIKSKITHSREKKINI